MVVAGLLGLVQEPDRVVAAAVEEVPERVVQKLRVSMRACRLLTPFWGMSELRSLVLHDYQSAAASPPDVRRGYAAPKKALLALGLRP